MRFLCCVVCSLALWGCESDVDLCGGGSVCGVDGNPYASYCEAGAAGIDVAYAGACNAGCSDITCDLACQYGLRVDAGCPVCECAPPPACMDESPCTRGDVCVEGRCAPPVDEDAGTDASFDVGTDSMIDSMMTCDDGEVPCAGGCVRLGTLENCTACGDTCDASGDSNATATCDRDSGCGFECNAGYGDCDGDGHCELLDTKENCGECGNSCAAFGACAFDPDAMRNDCTCPAGRVSCGGTCINPDNDGEFCGGCPGTSCAEGTRCRDGSCTDEGGDACTNPANWYCVEGAGTCHVSCGGIEFYSSEADGSPVCEGGGTALSCFVPVGGGDCLSCITVASRCCFGG